MEIPQHIREQIGKLDANASEILDWIRSEYDTSSTVYTTLDEHIGDLEYHLGEIQDIITNIQEEAGWI